MDCVEDSMWVTGGNLRGIRPINRNLMLGDISSPLFLLLINIAIGTFFLFVDELLTFGTFNGTTNWPIARQTFFAF